MKRSAWWLLLIATVVPALALAHGGADAAKRGVEASMLVTGTITVNSQGGVQSYTVQDSDKLPTAVQHIIQTTVSRWQFVPIVAEGKAVSAEAGMSLRIVADMTDAQHATIRVASAAFGCEARPKSNLPGECPAGTAVRYVRRQPPDYPRAAARAGVGGEVFLVIQVGRDGHVTQAAARQVNLYRLTDEPALYRKMLAEASLQAARKWQFSIPTTGSNTAKDHWIVQVPINYTVGGAPSDACGAIPCSSPRPYAWRAYIPGPVQSISWDHESTSTSSSTSTDAIASGGLFVRDTRFVLKTTLADGSGRS
ncbi:MAG: energy transducer TonB [Pseudomonadota bacterium]